MLRSLKTLFIASSALLLATVPAFAQEAPEVKLANTIEEVIDVLFQGGDDEASIVEKREKVEAILSRDFSYKVIIRRALGRNWKQLSEAQQDKITELATDLLVRAYTREFKDADRPTVSYDKPIQLTPNKIEVPSTFKIDGKTIKLAYRMANLKDLGWQVYDVLVEGISLVSNYRKQFDDHFRTKSAAELIELLREKLANEEL